MKVMKETEHVMKWSRDHVLHELCLLHCADLDKGVIALFGRTMCGRKSSHMSSKCLSYQRPRHANINLQTIYNYIPYDSWGGVGKK
jgi:hypothetical protein